MWNGLMTDTCARVSVTPRSKDQLVAIFHWILNTLVTLGITECVQKHNAGTLHAEARRVLQAIFFFLQNSLSELIKNSASQLQTL